MYVAAMHFELFFHDKTFTLFFFQLLKRIKPKGWQSTNSIEERKGAELRRWGQK